MITGVVTVRSPSGVVTVKTASVVTTVKGGSSTRMLFGSKIDRTPNVTPLVLLAG